MKAITSSQTLNSSCRLPEILMNVLLSASGQFVFAFDAAGKISAICPDLVTLLNYSANELLGKELSMLVHAEDLNMLNNPTQDGANKISELRLYSKEGEVRTCRCFCYSDATFRQGYCLVTDVTETGRIRNQVGLSPGYLQQVQSLNSIGSWEYNAKTQTVIWHDSLYQLYGLNKSECGEPTLRLFFSLVPTAQELEELLQNFRQLFETGQYSCVHRLKRPDGSIRYIHQQAKAITDENGVYSYAIGTAQDVTAQKEYEEKIEASERRFKALIEYSQDLISIVDNLGNILYISDNVEKQLGYHPAELMNKNALDLVHADDLEYIISKLSEVVFEKESQLDAFRFRHKDGSFHWYIAHVTNLLDEPEIRGIVVNSKDITKKRQYEEQIRSLSSIAEEAPHCIVLTDQEAGIQWVNKMFQQRSGYSLAEVKGKKLTDYITRKGNEETLLQLENRLREEKPFKGVFRNVAKGGTQYWVESTVQPLFDEKGQLVRYFAIGVDITERLQLQKKLKTEIEQHQKNITAAIIKGKEIERAEISRELHDNVNQLLATVKLYLEMIRQQADEALVDKAMELVNTSISEIRKISKALAPPALKEISLTESIEELIHNVSLATPVKISFKSHGFEQASLPTDVQIAIYRLVQENLNNILKYSQATEINIALSAFPQCVTLYVKDNGIGFDIQKKRNGIGINNMKNRVETLYGRLDIKTAPGKGYILFATIPLNQPFYLNGVEEH